MTPEAQATAPPNPALFFDTVNAYQRTEALKAAIELDVFTAVGEGKSTAKEIAQACGTAERGARILCDYLVIIGFLTKENDQYRLTPDSAAFLDRRAPSYLGGILEFILSPMLTDNFKELAAMVRKGGTVSEQGTLEPEHPIWVKFARAMVALMALPSQLIAGLVDRQANRKLKVLDIAAGHGLFGIAFAKRNQQAEVTALDWPNVLEVAKEHAQAAGVLDRFRTKPGSAFDVEYGTGYDLVLLTNFLHHFDPSTCETLLRKVHGALAERGRAVTLEFIPNEDRVSPPQAAGFSLMMLGSTPSGDAYTFSELDRMFQTAGFTRSELHELPPTVERVVISYK